MKKLLFIFLLASSLTLAKNHEDVINQCENDALTPFFFRESITSNSPSKNDNTIHVVADNAEINQKTIFLKNNVLIEQNKEHIYAEKIIYQRDTKNLNVFDNTIYGTPSFVAKTQNGDYNLNKKSGQLNDVDYLIKEDNAKGHAQKASINLQNNVQILSDATYTTCKRNNPIWHIESSKITLDQNNHVGIAKNSVFHLKGMPIFYLPYFSFPLNDERKSGLLLPSLGISESRGIEVAIPYYINIAPNIDATISPRFMQKRGLLVGSEFRYLTEDLRSNFYLDYIPHDAVDNTRRWAFKASQIYQPNNNFKVSINYQRVSDADYIEDISSFLNFGIQDNSAFLASHITAEYNLSKNYKITAKIQDYQVSKTEFTNRDRPYALKPSISGYGLWQTSNQINLQSESELNNFDREGSVSGWRIHQKLSASKRFETSYAFTEPKISYNITRYNLRNTAAKNQSPSRSLPTISLDNGLFFDRKISWFGKSSIQTIEPRLYYLYTPYKPQDEIPIFDSNLATNSYATMFAENRFIGKDRIGDSNQLTTAITSRVIDNNTGKELAKLSVGQIQYFQNRRVTLGNSVNDQDLRSRSNIIAEASAKAYDKFNLSSLVHYDTDNSRTEQYRWKINYRPSDQKSISLSQDFSRNDYKQLNLTGAWQFHNNWQTFGKWGYSQNTSETVDALIGLEYKNCCMGVRAIARRQRNNLINNREAENQFYLQFSFNSLGKIGNDTEQRLDAIIQDYKSLSSYQ